MVLLPGLAGGSGCRYVQYSAQRAYQFGLRPIVFNSRGTGGSKITTPQFYSASYTEDARCTKGLTNGLFLQCENFIPLLDFSDGCQIYMIVLIYVHVSKQGVFYRSNSDYLPYKHDALCDSS